MSTKPTQYLVKHRGRFWWIARILGREEQYPFRYTIEWVDCHYDPKPEDANVVHHLADNGQYRLVEEEELPMYLLANLGTSPS